MPFLWKFLRNDLRSWYDNSPWQMRKWRKCEYGAMLCDRGFHGSKLISDAWDYCGGEGTILAKVEVRGISDKDDDKQAWSEMRIVQAWRFTSGDASAYHDRHASSDVKVRHRRFLRRIKKLKPYRRARAAK